MEPILRAFRAVAPSRRPAGVAFVLEAENRKLFPVTVGQVRALLAAWEARS
jgi:hypothetical protein